MATEGVKQAAGIKAYTPDPSKYHDLSDPLITSRLSGARATMIPRARPGKFGGSRGFDPSQPGVMVVDPDHPGSVTIDVSKLSADSLQTAIAEAGDVGGGDEESRETTSNVFHRLVEETEHQAASPRLSQPTVQPQRTSQDFSPVPAAAGPVMYDDTEYEVKLPPTEQSATAATPVQPSISLPPLPPPITPTGGSNDAGVIYQMMQMQRQFMEAFLNQQRPAPPQTTPPPAAAPPAKVKSELAEAVGIPFLLAVAVKPAAQIVFELGEYGTTSARYHAIIEGTDCLVLVYDNRWDSGTQFLPPALGPDKCLTVHIVKADNRSKRTLKVVSFGFTFSFGCLDCTLLVIKPEAAPPVQFNDDEE